MQPLNSRTKRRSARMARARMFLQAHLGWLRGYPLPGAVGELTWRTVPGSHEVAPHDTVVTRTLIREAFETRKRLLLHYPHVLERLVGNRQRWGAGSEQLLGWCRDAVQRQQPWPEDPFGGTHPFGPNDVRTCRGIARQQRVLKRFLDAVAWHCWLEPPAFGKAIRWIEAEQETLARVARQVPADQRVRHLMLLWELVRRDGARAVQGFLPLLGDERIWQVPLHGSRHMLQQFGERKLSSTWRPHLPRAEGGRQLLGFLRKVRQQPQAMRRQMVRLAEAVLPELPFGQWADYWESAIGWSKASRPPIGNRQTVEKEARRKRQAQRDKLKNMLPPEVHLGPLFEAVEELCRPHHAVMVPPLLRLLPQVPAADADGRRLRAALLAYASGVVEGSEWHDYTPDHVAGLLRSMQPYGQELGAGRLVLFKEDLLDGWEAQRPDWFGLLHEILERPANRSAWDRTWQTLRALRPGEDWTSWKHEACAEIAHASANAEQARQRVLAVQKVDGLERYDAWFWETADDLAGDDAVRFAGLLTRMGDCWEHEVADLRYLQRFLRRAGWDLQLCDWLLDGRLHDASALAQKGRLLTQLHGTMPAPPSRQPEGPVPKWMQVYPPEVRTLLQDLAVLVDEPREVAADLLHRIVPDARRVETELEALRGRRGERIEVRRTRLQEQLRDPQPAEGRTLRRLVTRLGGMVRHELFANWEQQIQDRLARSVRRQFPGHANLGTLWQRGNLRAVAGLFGEAPRFRQLGLRLVKRRLGPRPWLPHDWDANQRLRQRLEQRGVRMEAWVHPPGPWYTEDPSLRAAFSDDPLEILQMGAYFNTCLSPGSCNYFSAIANAADINKRVLFVYDRRDKVVGRCLFALTDGGRMVTYVVYAHEQRETIEALVDQVRQDMLEALGVTLAARGTVSAPVAGDWYDDGVRSTCPFESLQLPAEASDWREDDVAEKLQALLHPLRIDANTVASLMHLNLFDQRPELVGPFLQHLEAVPTWTTIDLRRTLDVLTAAGEQQLLDTLLLREWVPLVRRDRWEDTQFVSYLLPRHAQIVLRLVRETRARDCRADEDEIGVRRWALSRAYQAIGRPNRAAALGEY